MTNRKTTKRALFTSTLALLMCVAMLIGTTFAWFTDTATTNVNKIEAGKLDVALEMATAWDDKGDPTTWASAEGQTLSFIKAAEVEKGNDSILWEPGCTYKLPELRIVNKGNLALKYAIQITGINGDAKLNEAIEWTIAYPDSEGLVDSRRVDTAGVKYLLAGDTDSGVISISGHMREDAGNEYQGLSIDGIAVTVVATQYTYESDSFDNQYDAGAPSFWDGTAGTVPQPEFTEEGDTVYHITNAAEFMALMNNAQSGDASVYTDTTICLDCDIDLGGATIKGFGNEGCIFGASFNGNGHTVSNFVIDRGNEEDFAGLFNYYCYGTLENLTVKDATVIGVCKVGALIGGVYDNATVKNCTVEDCTVIADRKVGGAIGYGQGADVSGCAVKNTTVYCATPMKDNAIQYGRVIGYKNTGLTETTTNTATNVNVLTGVAPTVVSSAAELAAALGTAETIILTKDIDANNSWTTAELQNRNLTLEGNGHTIKNLNRPLLNFYGGTLKINNLTVKDSIVVANGEGDSYLGTGVILEQAQWANLYMDNCHVKNCSLTGDNTRGAAIVGYWIGGGEIKNCTVDNATITIGGSAAGIVGHRSPERHGAYLATAKIANCAVTNSHITSNDDSWRVGAAIGTADSGEVTVNGFNHSGNTLTQSYSSMSFTDPGHPVYGRTTNSGSVTIS